MHLVSYNCTFTQSADLTHSSHSPIYEEVGDSATVGLPIVEKLTWPQLYVLVNKCFLVCMESAVIYREDQVRIVRSTNF